MKLSPCSFPHPVMNQWYPDEVSYDFNFEIRVVPGVTEWAIFCKVNTKNTTLAALLNSNQAEVQVHIECTDRFYRSSYSLCNAFEEIEFRIPLDQLSGDVQVTPFICAKVDLPEYTNISQHSDYAGRAFHVEKGDYLAIGPCKKFIVNNDYDPLAKLSSFIKIKRSALATKDAPATIDIKDTVVNILLPPKQYEMYGELKDRNGCVATISTVLILPALVYILTEMRRDNCEFSDSVWYQGIDTRFKKIGVDWQQTGASPFELAQHLLDTPLKRVAYELSAQRG